MKIITLVCHFVCVYVALARLDERITDYLLQNLHDKLINTSNPQLVSYSNKQVEENNFESNNQLAYEQDAEDDDLLRRRAARQTTRKTTAAPRTTARTTARTTTRRTTARTTTRATRVTTRASQSTTKASNVKSQGAEQTAKQTQNAYVKVGNTYNEVNSAIIINIDLRLRKSADAPMKFNTPPPFTGMTSKSY